LELGAAVLRGSSIFWATSKVQPSGEELPSGILKYIWTIQVPAVVAEAVHVYELRKLVTNVQ
jgi:hypothetical protein